MLFALSTVCSLLAYPLLFPFVALFLAVVAVRELRSGKRPNWLPGLRLPRRVWVRVALAPFALVAGLVALGLAAAAAAASWSARWGRCSRAAT